MHLLESAPPRSSPIDLAAFREKREKFAANKACREAIKAKAATLPHELAACLRSRIEYFDNWDVGPATFVYMPRPCSSPFDSIWITICPRIFLGVKDMVIQEEEYTSEGIARRRVVIKSDGTLEVFDRHLKHDQQRHSWMPVCDKDERDKSIRGFIDRFKQSFLADRVHFQKPTPQELHDHFPTQKKQ